MKHITDTRIISLIYDLGFNKDFDISKNGFLVGDVLEFLREEYKYHISLTPYSRKGFLVWESNIFHMITFNRTYNSFMPTLVGIDEDYDDLVEYSILKVFKLIKEVRDFDLGKVLNN